MSQNKILIELFKGMMALGIPMERCISLILYKDKASLA
jgi:hypothetical protein